MRLKLFLIPVLLSFIVMCSFTVGLSSFSMNESFAQSVEVESTPAVVVEVLEECDAACLAEKGLPVVTDSDVLKLSSDIVVGITSKTLKGLGLAFAISKLLLFFVLSPIGLKLMPFLKSKGYQLIVALTLNLSTGFLASMVAGALWYEALFNGAVLSGISELVYQITKKKKAAV